MRPYTAKKEPPSREVLSKMVDRLFVRFSMLYGTKFTDMWREIPLDDVKACWCDELSAYSIQQVAGAVNRLNEKPFPPTLPEFLDLCEKAAPPNIAAHLPYRELPKSDPSDPETVAARGLCMANVSVGFGAANAAWAYRAKRRWADGAIVYNPDTLKMINAAIENDGGRSDRV